MMPVKKETVSSAVRRSPEGFSWERGAFSPAAGAAGHLPLLLADDLDPGQADGAGGKQVLVPHQQLPAVAELLGPIVPRQGA